MYKADFMSRNDSSTVKVANFLILSFTVTKWATVLAHTSH